MHLCLNLVPLGLRRVQSLSSMAEDAQVFESALLAVPITKVRGTWRDPF